MHGVLHLLSHIPVWCDAYAQGLYIVTCYYLQQYGGSKKYIQRLIS
jgi:hypothetical protein